MKKLILALALSLSSGLAAQPLLPDPEQCLSSPGMERLAGSLFAQRFEAGLDGTKPQILAADHPDSVLVQRITDRLSRVVAYDRPHMRLQAKVVVDKEVNAFCIPAGYIYVYTGMLDHLRKHGKDIEDPLACVMGHEIAHAVLRHSIQRWRDAKDVKQVLANSESFSKALLAMSRAQESEADRYGVLYALRAGYKVTPALAVYRDLPEAPNRLLKSESDHPSNAERVKQVQKYLQQTRQLMGLWKEATQAAAGDRLVEAQTVLEILAAEFPNLASVHNNLGWVYYQQFEKQANPKPDFRLGPGYCTDLGLTLRGEEEHPLLQKADDEFMLATQCDPDLSLARLGQAGCALVRGELDRAEKFLAVDAANPSPGWHNLNGVLAQKRGQTDQARTHFEQALALDPKYLPALFNSGSWAQLLALEPGGYWADQARARGASGGAPVPAPRQQALGLKLGMSAEQIAAKLGPPAQEEKLETRSRRQLYPKLGAELWLGPEGLSMVRWEPRQPDPESGLKLGADEASISGKLGSPQRSSQDDQGHTFWHYPSRGLTVELSQGKLSALLLSRP